MEIPAIIVIMSHLSDVQDGFTLGDTKMLQEHINFAKFLIMRYKNNLDQSIDPDKLWNIYKRLK